jgi:hypothetical protein
LDEADSTSRVLPYASLPVKQSWYAIASLVVSALSVLWMAAGVTLPLPVDNSKHHRIGTVAAVLALILAFGARREANRRRGLVRASWWAGALALLLYIVLQPL